MKFFSLALCHCVMPYNQDRGKSSVDGSYPQANNTVAGVGFFVLFCFVLILSFLF